MEPDATNTHHESSSTDSTNPDTCTHKRTARALPNPIFAAYPNWGLCGPEVSTAIAAGINVVIWFASNLAAVDGVGVVETPLNIRCVAEVAKGARDAGFRVVHLLSIGGWNAPHPADIADGEGWWSIWQSWNEEQRSLHADLGFEGFDGFDWDLEGNDTPESEYNEFSYGTLDIMKVMSLRAKQAGFVVAMAPPQSYLDITTERFSRSLRHPPNMPWYQDFRYHARNVYAYLLADGGIASFDFISVQLYEGYSTAGYGLANGDEVAYLGALVRGYQSGVDIDFADDVRYAALGRQQIKVPASKLVLGLANGWAKLPGVDTKFVYIASDTLRALYRSLDQAERPRGVMYWCLAEEGAEVDNKAVVLYNDLSWVLEGV